MGHYDEHYEHTAKQEAIARRNRYLRALEKTQAALKEMSGNPKDDELRAKEALVLAELWLEKLLR